MQLYAVTSEEKRISVGDAETGVDYLCIECRGRLRVRVSSKGRFHFYHLRSEVACRHNGKSEEHIQLQELIRNLIGENAELECPFPEIGRIADVAWHERKIVFEVQCSPISPAEVRARCADYEKAGWYVIWILFAPTFYRKKLKDVPLLLQKRTHYYASACCNEIFDCMHHHYVTKRFRVDLGTIELCDSSFRFLPRFLLKRQKSWRYFVSGDLLWHAKYGLFEDSWLALVQEKPLKRWYAAIFSFVRTFWYLILETALRSRMR